MCSNMVVNGGVPTNIIEHLKYALIYQIYKLEFIKQF